MVNLRGFLFGTSTASSTAGELGVLILRVGVGLAMAFAHGLGKLPPKAGFIESVGHLGFPAPTLFAWAAGLSEFLGGLLLALGVLTRPAALFMLITLCVAFFMAGGGAAFKERELAFAFGLPVLFFLFFGGGRYSLDGMMRK